MADRGRPSIYTPELAKLICEKISGGTTLAEIDADPDLPGQTTVLRWARDNEDFRVQYARARDESADVYADRALREAMQTKELEWGAVAGARLRWDALRWHAGKCAPKRYSDKLINEHTGPEGGPVQIETITRKIIDPVNG